MSEEVRLQLQLSHRGPVSQQVTTPPGPVPSYVRNSRGPAPQGPAPSPRRSPSVSKGHLWGRAATASPVPSEALKGTPSVQGSEKGHLAPEKLTWLYNLRGCGISGYKPAC